MRNGENRIEWRGEIPGKILSLERENGRKEMKERRGKKRDGKTKGRRKKGTKEENGRKI